MRYNTYEEFKRAEEKRVNECPLFFAFSKAQLDEALEERHATVNDIYRLRSISGAFYLKKDSQAVRDYFEHDTGLEECMKDHDFAVSAFYYEMCNHEYGINYYQRNEDNMLAYLIKQQGYDVTTEYIGGEDIACSDSKFLKSVANELLNGYYNVCQCLVVLTTASLKQLDDLADILLKRDNCKKTITVSKDTMLGLLAPFIGGGSTLDIYLDKDFEFSTDMIYDVQIESRDQRSGVCRCWSVDSIYGLCGDAWDSKMTIK